MTVNIIQAIKKHNMLDNFSYVYFWGADQVPYEDVDIETVDLSSHLGHRVPKGWPENL